MSQSDSPAVPAKAGRPGPFGQRLFGPRPAHLPPPAMVPPAMVPPAARPPAAPPRPAPHGLGPGRGLKSFRGPPARIDPEPPAGLFEPPADLFGRPQPPAADTTEEIHARVGKVIFSSPSSGFLVLAVKLKGQRGEERIAVTTTVRVEAGDDIVARGRWTTRRGAAQFAAEMIQLEIPREAKGIAAWLAKGAVAGVGKAAVKKLLARFGEDLPGVIDDPSELAKAGIREAQAKAIAKAWSANAHQGELVSMLLKAGLRPKQAAKVIETYGAAVKKVLQTNPWELTEIEGIGFPTADHAARLNGLDMACPPRIQAGLAHVLNECLNREGHCGLPPRGLVSAAARVLEVAESAILSQMPGFVDGVRVIEDPDTGLIYPKMLWDAECDVAEHLAALIARSRGAMSAAEAEEAITRAEREIGKALDRDGGQFEAAMLALTNPVVIITGGPGTGKSTTQKIIVTALSYHEKKVELAAPTGRAAKRLSEASGQPARTIHRLLEFSPVLGDFAFNEEVSMVDIRLMASQVRALPPDCCLLLVGDYDQLPSVGPGQVLRDLIASGLIPVARLTKVHRTAEGSGIAIAAKRINGGLTPMDPDSPMRGFRIVECSDAAIVSQVVDIVRFELPEMGFDPMRDVQVLAAMRKGDAGVTALNIALKAALNPALEDENTVSMIGRQFTVGDRVMQLRNDYGKGVYNGEVGTVTAVGAEPDRTPFMTVDFSGVEARYKPEEVAQDIEYAFAGTVHKSQGGEFPVVIFVAPHDHRRMLTRNLVYTGVTRARTECVMVGTRSVIDHAVTLSDSFRRHTGLQVRLRRAMEAERGHVACVPEPAAPAAPASAPQYSLL